MFYTSTQYKEVSGSEPVLLPSRAKRYVTVKNMHRDWPRRPMGCDMASATDHHEGYPERPLLDQCPGIPPVALEQRGIIHASSLLAEIELNDLACQRAIYG